jgi:oligopeptide transport system ATP-binding protein
MASASSQTLLNVQGLKTQFATRDGVYKAVNGASFHVEAGKTLAIVGESGSGKSVSMLSILGLIPQPPGKIIGGQAMFEGRDLLQLSTSELRKIRGKDISMIFQDPMTSLNPYLTVSTQLTETLQIHNPSMTYKEALRRSIEGLELVGIPDAAQRVTCYPHQFSGGMRQRVMITMALLNRPKLLIADEPTTALDVTIQAQILRLLKKLQDELGMAMILITHDLGVVAGVADSVSVMYAGRVVEEGNAEDIFYKTAHPYTQGLLHSTPPLLGEKRALFAIPGLPPDPSRLPEGCSFAARCHRVKAECRVDAPLPVRVYTPSHNAHCHWEA